MPIRPEYREFYKPPEWPAIRAQVFARAGYRCAVCGQAEGKRYWNRKRAKWVVVQLGCAHLDGDPANNDLETNLRCLCRACHLKHDAGQHRMSRATRKDRARPLLEGM